MRSGAKSENCSRRIGEEPGFFGLAFGLFSGRLGWVNMLLMLVQAVLFLGGAYAAWMFFEAGDVGVAAALGPAVGGAADSRDHDQDGDVAEHPRRPADASNEAGRASTRPLKIRVTASVAAAGADFRDADFGLRATEGSDRKSGPTLPGRKRRGLEIQPLDCLQHQQRGSRRGQSDQSQQDSFLHKGPSDPVRQSRTICCVDALGRARRRPPR